MSVVTIEQKIGLLISNHVSANAHAGLHVKGGGPGGNSESETARVVVSLV